MAKKSQLFIIEEIPSEFYAEITKAQLEALPFMSLHLVKILRSMLANGALVKVDNKIIPNPERSL